MSGALWVGSNYSGPTYMFIPRTLLLEPEGEPWETLFREGRGFTYEAYRWDADTGDWEYISGSACNWFDIEPEVGTSFLCNMLDDAELPYPLFWQEVRP